MKGYTYLFHDKEQKFYADFIDIIIRADGYKTLLVKKYINESSVIPMPFSLINKIELVDTNNTNNISNCNDIILEDFSQA